MYCYDDDDEVHISKYIGNDKNVIVPQQIESKTVKIIDVGAFSDCTAESIVIPEGVEEIQYNAFCDCPNLKIFLYLTVLKLLAGEHLLGVHHLRSSLFQIMLWDLAMEPLHIVII